ncbi:MAG: hypothetical protein K6B67_00430 [Lachnospiraceae bacterium]|nr:hypothetical protein [Lachnospiraceae bacterium]
MKKAIRIGLVVILSAVLIVGYYYHLSHKNDTTTTENNEEITEVDKIITKDFKKDYPATPREVVKWYNRITTALYAEEYSDKEMDKMAMQIRELLDDELLEYNPETTYIASLKQDVIDYNNREKVILQSKVCDSADITYAMVNGYHCAYVDAYYFTREGSTYSRTYEKFVLRQAKDGKWKILTFKMVEGDADDWK